MAGRIVIFSGGTLGGWALREIREGDTLVGADRGALFLVRGGYRPDMSVGDFDSVSASEKAEIREASQRFEECDPIAKDRTDTEMAFDWALSRGPSEILLLGATGTRFDHSLANVQLLVVGAKRNIPCSLMDEHNRIQLTDGRLTVNRGRFPQASLLPLTPDVTGITLEGFRYPLRDATIAMGQSLGVSNVLEAETGTVSVGSGWLLVVQSAD